MTRRRRPLADPVADAVRRAISQLVADGRILHADAVPLAPRELTALRRHYAPVSPRAARDASPRSSPTREQPRAAPRPPTNVAIVVESIESARQVIAEALEARQPVPRAPRSPKAAGGRQERAKAEPRPKPIRAMLAADPEAELAPGDVLRWRDGEEPRRVRRKFKPAPELSPEMAERAAQLTHLSIRAARQARGLSIRGLAELSRVDAMTVWRVETGKSRLTSRLRAKIAEALELERTIRCRAAGIEPGSFAELRDLVPWTEDPYAQAIVAMHPDGLTGEQIADVLGLSPGWTDMVMAQALAKLRDLAVQDDDAGAECRRWLELVRARMAERIERESARDWMTADGEE